MNICTCVLLQLFVFNFTGGKLLSMLAFSKEVQDYYYNKYTICIKNYRLMTQLIENMT